MPLDSLARADPAQCIAELVQRQRLEHPAKAAQPVHRAGEGLDHRAELPVVDHWSTVGPAAARARRWCERNRRKLAAVAG